jgi:tungstate transport system ATP-binding protein
LAKTVLAVQDLVVRYGESEVVNVPSLRVREQEVLAIMGPNGAGKSTLLRVMAFLESPTAGTIAFQGAPVGSDYQELLPLHRRTAVIFQEPLLLDTSVFQNVALGLKLRGIGTESSRVHEWLGLFGIDHLSERPARSLSSGEAQRANLARAFVVSPEVLLLDEPFSSLDPPTRDILIADFKDILSRSKTTTVFVTHDRDEAQVLGDRVAVMMKGRIPQLDIPERVFNAPADEEVARFVGVDNVLPGRVSRVSDGLVTVKTDGGEVRVEGDAHPGDEVLVCIRPDDIQLSRNEMDAPSVENRFQGRVEKVIPFGFSQRIVLDCGVPILVLATRRVFSELDLREGENVQASFQTSTAHLIRRS